MFDIISGEKMKFAVMAFDEGTGLSEHSAPGEALIFGLEGEGIIGYEGKEYAIKAHEPFCKAPATTQTCLRRETQTAQTL